MKLLLRAALRSRKHLALLLGTFLTLFALTLANTMEMCALGVLSNLHESKINAPVQKESNPLSWLIQEVKYKFEVTDNINALIAILVCVAVFKAIWLFASRYTTQILSIRVSRDLRQQYFEHIQSLPMSFYQQHNIGGLSSRVVGDAGQIATSINSWMTNYLQTPFTLITNLIMCFFLSWELSLVIFFGVPLIILPIVFLAKRVKRVSRQLQRNQEKFASVLIDFLAGIQTVKIFAMEMFSLKKYKEQNDRMAVLESKTAKYGLLTRPILHAITTLSLASVVLFGLYTLGMSISQLIVFCGLLHLIYEPVKKFADENANIQRGVVAAERMFEVLSMRSLLEDRPGAIDLQQFVESIEFDRVWFRYEGEWVLKDLSFKVKKGETIAIVGPTGAGKSTIVQLMPRLYDVQKGEIRIDGKPLAAYTQKSLRECIGFVSQRPFLFLDTVASNIAYGRNFSRESIENAAKRAHAEEFIIRLPQKYDSLLAEAGKSLSGGQQQRLAIARALVKNAPILILDEATSALDAISENRIKKAIAELHGEITQIIIAHRLATIEHADRIIYLERGEKVAEGTRDELLRTCVGFKQMWEALYNQEKAEV
ncbi:MAG: ABC transporter ATP-binding protein [Chlamydiales bacterium]